jgi:methylmalonyl-CoA/ethylmalonyl-CoA epimerase
MPDSALATVKSYSVTLSVADLNQTATWYKDKLGFTEVKRKDYPEFSTALVFLEKNGYRVELIYDSNAKAGITRSDPPTHTGVHGISQFAFETDDLPAVRSQLEERGVEIVWQFENADLEARFLFIRDPEQNLIQFLERL